MKSPGQVTLTVGNQAGRSLGGISLKQIINSEAAELTVGRAGASHQEHAAHVRKLISDLSRDTALFKKVYKYAFVAGREKDQKSLALDNALIYWSMLFSAPGVEWKGKHDWLDLWKTFLGEKWTRSVNRDMWNMILEFALKSVNDESLSFWSEDGAWPSVIDDFVEWCRQKGIGKPETMEVDGQ